MSDENRREQWVRLAGLGLLAYFLWKMGFLKGLFGLTPGKPKPGGKTPERPRPSWKNQEDLKKLHNDRIVWDKNHENGARVEPGPAEPIDGAKGEVLTMTWTARGRKLSATADPNAMTPGERGFFEQNFPGTHVTVAHLATLRLNRKLGYFLERDEAVGRGASWTWSGSGVRGVQFIVKQGPGVESVQFHIRGVRGPDARKVANEMQSAIEGLLRAHGIDDIDPSGRGKYIDGP